MFDIWSFLLQTLTVSGAAALILLIKALFKDKLTPKWQFAVWSVLGIIMLLPAGMFGRYTLFRWQLMVELLKSWFGVYSFTKVLFPIPIIQSIPQTIAEWIFTVYVLGILVLVIKYLIAYFKLRRVLKFGDVPSDEKLSQINKIADEQGIKIGKVIEISQLPSAFIYGVFRPVLIIPAGSDLNEKIILHELFHLKNKDTMWSVIICALRCLHWCNPLIVYCAERAINDMESRCDQYVLEHLEGEERREYGHILLSMANDRFSKTPGSTCINNGGKNIRARIANIARFKKYPQGMGLVSICVIILLAFPLVIGAQATNIREFNDSVRLTLASARSIPCTTPAGAFDTYGKAVLERNGYYRAMCAPEDMQESILKEMLENDDNSIFPLWDPGIDEWANKQEGFYIYNLKQVDDDTYEGLFVIELNYPPDGKPAEFNMIYLAVQNLRVEKENGRWVAIPLEDFRHVETISQSLAWGCTGLPGIVYSGESHDFRVDIVFQTIHTVDSKITNQNDIWFLSSSYYDTTPKPDAEFTSANTSHNTVFTYLGLDENKESITHIGVTSAPMYEGEKRPTDMIVPTGNNSSGGSSTGYHWSSKELHIGWDSVIPMNGGGSGGNPKESIKYPRLYAADLYINNQKVAEMELILQRGDHQ